MPRHASKKLAFERKVKLVFPRLQSSEIKIYSARIRSNRLGIVYTDTKRTRSTISRLDNLYDARIIPLVHELKERRYLEKKITNNDQDLPQLVSIFLMEVIDNSLDSIGKKCPNTKEGNILINLKVRMIENEPFLHVEVIDNGTGFPINTLGIIGKKPFTDKPGRPFTLGGTGVYLKNCLEELESLGGIPEVKNIGNDKLPGGASVSILVPIVLH